jgi:hypothetical protein
MSGIERRKIREEKRTRDDPAEGERGRERESHGAKLKKK